MTSQSTLEPAPASREPGRRRRLPRRLRLLGLLCGVLLAVGATALVRTVNQGPKHEADAASKVPIAWQRPVVTAAHLVERSGVEITQVSLTGGGGLVDLRYKVIDTELANELHDPATPPAVVDEKTGLVVHDLLMSHSHTGPFKPGVTYYLIFNNPGDWVRHGSKVTVLLGDAQVEHVTVP